MFKYALFPFLFLLTACTGQMAFSVPEGGGNIYYVDSLEGSDSNPGTISQPWQSLAHGNDGTVKAGDHLLLKRGGIYRGPLKAISGRTDSSTLYGAYGTGEKPLILGSENRSRKEDWISQSDRIWRSADSFPVDIGALFVNGTEGIAAKKWSLSDLMEQGDFYYDRDTGRFYLYSFQNPADFYSSLELALTRFIVDMSRSHYVIFEDLQLRFGGSHGFGGGETDHITIRNCDISYIGGGWLEGSDRRRYGNGIEFWGNASNHLVESNRIYEIYDTALTNQNHTRTVVQSNIVYRNNLIWNCGLASFEVWNRPETSRTEEIYFIHNSSYNAGGGWGGNRSYREDPYAFHVALFGHVAQTEQVYIENNLFCSDTLFEGLEKQILFFDETFESHRESLMVDYNIWYQSINPLMVLTSNNGIIITLPAEIEAYRQGSGNDHHSLFSDPLLVDPSSGDFRLQDGSPAIDKANESVHRDRDFYGSVLSKHPDIGAVESVDRL